jgi:DNA polymerase II small subunit
MELNETINYFAKKGFLLDRESIDFFFKLNNNTLAEEVLNKIFQIAKTRMITKKVLSDNYVFVKPILEGFSSEKNLIIGEFFKDSPTKEDIKIPILEEKKQETDLKILSSRIIPYRKIEVKDFITHFRNRYNFFKELLNGRKELSNLISINKIGNNRNFSIIGLISTKRETKNKNLILEVEDLTGKAKMLISADKEDLMRKAKEAVLDDVIGIKCSGGGEIVYANDLFFADSFIAEKKRAENEVYALFISDIHIGSKLFLENSFMKFINWINGEGVEGAMKEKVKKIKYIFVIGDNIDGVGVYPGQESLLQIKDCKSQYKRLAELFRQIPENIKIIMCPGQHDAVRVPEPQPALDEGFAKDLCEMKNVYLVCNPSLVEINCEEKKKGFKVLMYHGASMIRNWMDEIEELRLGKAHLNPSKISKYLLRHRHLSPTHSANVYVPTENEDSLAIKEVPDILVTGDLHKADVDIYNNILIIAGSCWQSTTPYEEKLGNRPDPCKVPMLNLKTREIKILDFSG